MDRFISDYLAAWEAHAAGQAARVLEAWGGTAAAVHERFAKELEGTRSFLFAEDVAFEERPRTRRVRAGLLFIESYRELPLLAWPRLLVDAVVELEEELVLWRTRHARMVERTIGRRAGTGGSPGVEYLDRTAAYRIFTELWAVRTILLPREALPNLKNPGAYGFAR